MTIAEFIGFVARPFAIIWTSFCGGVAMIVTSLRVNDGNDAGVLMGAIALIVTGIYAAKSVEEWKKAASEAGK